MLATLLLCAAGLAADPAAAADEPTKSLDPRVVIEEFAAAPDIVTPTGIAIDRSGRVLVIESHTHFRPDDYAGPPADRIRAFEDTNGDGRADKITNFYEGGVATMNLAVYEDGSVFVATRMEITRLFDRDRDGRADDRQPIAHLETKGDYPHNGLSGFAFDALGNIYFGLGENLGADYRLVGSDGTSLAGGGEGGNVYRCRPDGSGLTRIATGFWNPFHLCCDAFDHLFAVDNDPDSRPPCRLIHVVPAGDYGYRFRNGRKGVHPFTAWNGELPGTLPMAAGTGEAPSGILAYESDMLPAEYRGTLLVTSWGDHRIERFRLDPRGASFAATAEPVITGGENFRPVGIALADDGSLFVSDWVDKSYSLHGKGRVWRIRAKDATPTCRPREPLLAMHSSHRPLRQRAARDLAGLQEGDRLLRDTARSASDAKVRAEALMALARADARDDVFGERATMDDSPDVRALAVRLGVADVETLQKLAAPDAPAEVRAEALRRLTDPRGRQLVVAALADRDPFISQAAWAALAESATLAERLQMAASDASAVRLAAIDLLRLSNDPAAREPLARLLSDADPQVRFAAIQWVAEEGLTEFRSQLTSGLAQGATTRQLFEAYLAALERLDGIKRGRKDEWSGDQYVLGLVADPQTTAAVRARALRALDSNAPGLTRELLGTLLQANDMATRVEALRTLRQRNDALEIAQLARLVADRREPVQVRAEAILGLSASVPEHRALLLDVAEGGESSLRHESLRALRGAELSAEERARVAKLAEHEQDREIVSQVLGNAPQQARPDRHDTAAWLQLLGQGGDAAAGERVFFDSRGAACYRCHQVDGRGGTIGPELSVARGTLTPIRLVESLLEPSKEIAPQFVLWSVVRQDGTVFSGVLLAQEPDGTRRYGLADGQILTVKESEVAGATPQANSIMPDNLCEQMTVGELRDMLAFLRAER